MRPILTALALTIPLAASAHETEKGPNGGRVVEAGAYHVELVAKGTALEAWLTDRDEKALAPVGFKAVALLVVAGKSQRIPMEPAGNRLVGTATMDLPAAPKGAVQLTAPGGKQVNARFN